RAPAEHDVPGRTAQRPPSLGSYFRKNAATLHSHLARRQSYARDFALRFVEGANYISPEVSARIRLRGFRHVEKNEGTAISKKTLSILKDWDAQDRTARDVQESTP